jgi:hypothetical protein
MEASLAFTQEDASGRKRLQVPYETVDLASPSELLIRNFRLRLRALQSGIIPAERDVEGDMRLNGATIYVKDLSRVAEFYEMALG